MMTTRICNTDDRPSKPGQPAPAPSRTEPADGAVAYAHRVARFAWLGRDSDADEDSEDDGYEGDPAEREPAGPDPDDVADDDPAPLPSRPGHVIMEGGDIRKALAGFDGNYECLSSGEEQRARSLVQYRTMSLFRPHLIGSPAMLDRLDALDRQQPNFAAVTRLVRRAAHLSQVSGKPLRIQPMVLLGKPGVGKSLYARCLADRLGTSFDIINGSSIPDVGSITGYPPVWRGAGPGRLAKFAVSSTRTSPFIFVDEAEKIRDYESTLHPLDRLLSALEYTTACCYQDENLQVPMRLQHAIFLFACNSLDGLSEPFLDRTITIRIPDLDQAQRDAVLDTMLGEVAALAGLSITLAGRDALAPFRPLSLRRCRLGFEIAIARAVEQGRRFLTAQDLAEATATLGSPDQRRPIGFIRHQD